MPRPSMSKRQATEEIPLGEWLLDLQQARGVPLRVAAAAAKTDTTLVSKIEFGQRLPTESQTKGLATYFGVAAEKLEPLRIVEKIGWKTGTVLPRTPQQD